MKKFRELYEDKCAIAHHVVGLLDHGDRVFVDGGSTTANIFEFLNQNDKDVSITTHSVFALMNVGARNKLFVIGGQLDNRYGALYPETREKCYEILEPLKVKKIILAAAALTFHDGPLVEAEDGNNQRFKEVLIRKCLDDKTIKLLIVADWTKFIVRKDSHSWQAVVRPEEWDEVRRRDDYLLVTKLPDDTVPAAAATAAVRMIERFRKNEKNHGMRVVALT